ncbi:Vegetative incompatibility protein HET-E-1 [Daldinia childiae]|uniref:Vegetative incompatibility protein HET-E-1 n=1 Tax=Daldinia childiae TaxID=326645 RepID=UPI001444A4BC|nr:Vegetative incompatibility protein HET-E-1 [Daldinia childiae]KAF3055084.1 Vegetative incompatibility protein HET-E-1 [Daldinia childiae]
MRLLNTTSLELKEFQGDTIPPYAILSHTWIDGEEVSFHDFIDLSPSTTTKSGFLKIQGACRIARQDGIEWIWIDTNCIDKASSAELTEAINSMYNWYRQSTVCYAYLADVPKLHPEKDAGPLRPLRKSNWLRRGWTLQELIGPRRLVFFSRCWTEIGDRSQLAGDISAATGIETPLLQGRGDLRAVSIAKKMSWAARRRTTRAEDAAYCLLGLFDVNMPLLYGEGGAKAFARLQEEIIRTSNDHTIFCWSRSAEVEAEVVPRDWSSMLAPSPAAFCDAGEYVPVDAWEAPMPYAMTNLGLSIYLPVVYTLTQLFVVLDAGLVGSRSDMRACIAVQRTNQRRSGSNILDRSRFLESPVILSKKATDTRERYSLFIRSRFVPQPGIRYSHHPRRRSVFKHGILLFADPTAKRLLSTGRQDAPLGAVGYDIETHPPGLFDEDTALLRLPAFEGGSSLLTSGLLRICFKSPQATDFYLFFAVISTFSGKEVWHCSIHSAEDFFHIKLAIREHVEEGGVPVQEEVLIHNCLRNEVWENRRKQLTAHTPDESLFVSIGGTIALYPDTDIRAAMLSGKCESPYSVPISATDLSGVVDETDDSDYVDESEERGLEDWDSSNEEEESGSSLAVGEDASGLRRWDVNSSVENSQTLSSAS